MLPKVPSLRPILHHLCLCLVGGIASSFHLGFELNLTLLHLAVKRRPRQLTNTQSSVHDPHDPSTTSSYSRQQVGLYAHSSPPRLLFSCPSKTPALTPANSENRAPDPGFIVLLGTLPQPPPLFRSPPTNTYYQFLDVVVSLSFVFSGVASLAAVDVFVLTAPLYFPTVLMSYDSRVLLS